MSEYSFNSGSSTISLFSDTEDEIEWEVFTEGRNLRSPSTIVLSSDDEKEIPIGLLGNDKRKYICKKLGGVKKRFGHDVEKQFTKQYNIEQLYIPIEYGATSDTSIHPNHPICSILRIKLNVYGWNVSNKSGNSIQFTLGKIPELKNIDVCILTPTYSYDLMRKYLKKCYSAKPADLLVYQDVLENRWIFFNMDNVVHFISVNCIWRKLKSGRIKGDFKDYSKKGKSQYITYEYRDSHRSYFLGVNCGKGKKFIELLMYNLPYYVDPIRVD